MPAPLRVGDVAQQLGVSPDTVREYVRRGYLRATRTPTGQFLFDEQDVDLVRRGDPVTPPPPPAELPPPPATSRTENATEPRWQKLAPWETDVEAAKASLTLDELEAERERRADAREQDRRLREEKEQVAQHTAVERQRLQRQKQRVFQTICMDSEQRPRIARAIEEFVTSERVPPWLTDGQQLELIATHARSVLSVLRSEAQVREAERRRVEVERQQAETVQWTERMRELLAPAPPPAPTAKPPPRTVADALRLRRE